MKKLKRIILSSIYMLAVLGLSAQEFASPTMSFSTKKPMYVTLKDGTELEGTLKSFKYDKSLIEEIKMEDSLGNKTKISPAEIAFMYVSPSGYDKLAKKLDFAADATKWDNDNIDGDIINKGYIYFENSLVVLKKDKTEELLMQLLNPGFSNKIKVYHDPRAGETASFAPGGIKVAGGDAKSYYIKKDDAPAKKIAKKTYEENFTEFFSACEPVISEFGTDIKWGQINEVIYKYSQECE